MPEINQEELREWLLHPVTRALREQWKADRERLKESWAAGAFEGEPLLEAKARGQCEVLQQLGDLDYEQFEESEK